MSELPARNHPVLRLNTICPYYTMFPLSFPFQALSGAKPGDRVLDPFCGRGTSLYAARLRGLPAVGVDANPVATAIAAAKLKTANPGEVISLARDILTDPSEPEDIPEGEFWGLCYHPETLHHICKLREHFLKVKFLTATEIVLRAIMLGILHGPLAKTKPSYLSNQMPRTYATKPQSAVNFWTRRSLTPRKVSVLDLISRRASFSLQIIPPSVDGEVYLGDSRIVLDNMPGKPFRWIITSPPYYGMRTYVPDQWLRYWFIGGPSDVTYTLENQLNHSSERDFIDGLASVWRAVAKVCHPGANLIIRFGALPSASKDPLTVLSQSLLRSSSGWRICDVRDAGIASSGRRQAEQFINAGMPIPEIDVYAVLEG